MGADCAGDASIQHSISNGIIISIKPFKFSAEDRPFSALSITLARDLNDKSKKKKEKIKEKDKDHTFKNRFSNTAFFSLHQKKNTLMHLRFACFLAKHFN